MDTLTHALSGALIARAMAPAGAPGPGSAGRITVGLVAGAFPDIDNVLRLGDPLTFLNAHRGITHSLVMAPLWALLLAWLMASVLGRVRHEPQRWQALYGVALLGVLIHIAGDVITPYGTQLLAPFSVAKYSISTTFVIDPLFTGLVVAGLIAARWSPRAASRVALGALVGYVAFQAGLRQEVLAIGEAHAAHEDLRGAEIRAYPQPFSPFHWKVVVSDGAAHREGRVDLWSGALGDGWPWPGVLGRMAAAYRPLGQLDWRRYPRPIDGDDARGLTEVAWTRPGLADFRRFAEVPALYRIDRGPEAVCVWFMDLRFVLPEMPPPFRFGMCRTPEQAAWQLFQLTSSGQERKPLRRS